MSSLPMLARSLFFGFAAAIIAPASGFGSLSELPATSIRQEPYNLCGRVESRLGSETVAASGSLAHTNTVLTAADAVWNSEDGFATKVVFQRARRGSNIAQSSKATFIVLLVKFTTSSDPRVTTAANVAGLFFRTNVADGRHLDLRSTRDQLLLDNQNFIVGYAETIGNGTRMASYSGVTFSKVSGSLLYRPSHPSRVSTLSKGGPVIHTVFISSTGVHADRLVGIVVDRFFIRGFSAREISIITGVAP